MTEFSEITIASLWKRGDYIEASFCFKNQLQSFISNPELYKNQVRDGFFKSPFYFTDFNKPTEFVYACITIFNEVNIVLSSHSKITDKSLVFLQTLLTSAELRMCLSSSIDLAILNSLRNQLINIFIQKSGLDNYKRIPFTGKRKRSAVLINNLGENHEVNTAISQISCDCSKNEDVFILFLTCSSSKALEWVRGRNIKPIQLTGGLKNMRDQILELNLYLLIYGSDLTCFVRQFTFLAGLRLADIQIANQSSASSTQISEIDYFLMGECFYSNILKESFSEKILKFNDLGFRYNDYNHREKNSILKQKYNQQKNRKKIFIGTGANIYKLTRECLDVWMRILEASLNTVILIAPFNRSVPKNEKKRFNDHIINLCKVYGIESSRIRVLDNLGSRFNFQNLMINCDILIDSHCFSSGNAFLDAFETFTPAIPLASLQLRSQFSSGVASYFSNHSPNIVSIDEYVKDISTYTSNKGWITDQNKRISEQFSYDSLYNLDTMAKWKHLIDFS